MKVCTYLYIVYRIFIILFYLKRNNHVVFRIFLASERMRERERERERRRRRER